MEKLVEVRNNEVFTNTKILAEKLSSDKYQHRNVMIALERLISDKELFERLRDHATVTNAKYCNAKFIQTTYTTSRNNVYKMYEMNEEGFMLLVMQLSKFRKAIVLQQQFINAFQKMKQLIKHQQETIHDLVAYGIAPIDPINTKPKINNKKRDKLVRSYYRSSRGKKDCELNEAIKLTQLEFDFYKA